MSISEIVLIGIALSMDAFAVCVASSMVYTNMTWLRKLSMPIMFGLFQGIMPILGFFLGSLFASFIEKWSGPISLLILGIIGINMIREGLAKDEETEPKKLTLWILLVQAVATSIDAFAVGVCRKQCKHMAVRTDYCGNYIRSKSYRIICRYKSR